MNDACRQFDTLIAHTARLTAKEAADLEAHLAGCAACRDLARVMRPLEPELALTATPDLAFTATLDTLGDQAKTTAARADPQTSDANKNRYRITGEVGRGGLGRVMEALDRVLDRPVALKELFSADATLRRRFVREALITARLQHPSIVPIYDVGHLGDSSPFYAMKLVAGQPFDKSIAEATTLAQRLALLPRVLAVADAMAYAHSKRVIHRDLKPANILIGAFGETIVIDWGLAKDLAVDDEDALDAGPYRSVATDQTAVGAMMGTPAFMSPEQAAAGSVDERADVYALGAILYHVISGAAPHGGATLEEMVRRVIAGEVRPVTEREPAVPRDLAAIVNKAMALAPSNRYANAGGLADDLRRFLTGQLVASHSYGVRELVRRWVKRHRAAVTVSLAAAFLMAVVGVVSVMRVMQASQRADQQRSIAEREKNTAMEMLANLFEEQGRQELLAGRPARAAAYLSEAYARAHDPGVGLRALLAEAMRSVEAARLSLDTQTGAVSAAAFSPDGARIVTADADHLGKVWDAATGKVVATLTGHEELIESASFSPDSSLIVTASADQTARLWDARTGNLLATLPHAHPLWFAAFSPDGAQVVTTGESSAVSLWDVKTAKLVASLDGHRGDVSSAAFSKDGTRVVTASADRTAKVWDVGTARLLHSLEGHRGEVVAAAFSPDGAQIVTASDDHTAQLWNAQTGAPVASLVGHSASVHAAAYSPDGTRVVTASDDRSAKLWDAHTGKLLLSLDGHTGAVNSAAFSADGARVVTTSDDRTTKLWDVRTGKLLASFEGHRDDLRSASFSPDGTQILTASADGTAKLWRATSSEVRIALDGNPDKPARGALSPDGAKLVTIVEGGPEATNGATNDATNAATNEARLWDARSGKLLASLQGHRGEVTAASFDPASTRVVTASADHSAKLWDARTGKVLFTLEHPVEVKTAGFSADGARVVTSGGEQRVWIWNATSGALLAKFERSPTDYPVRLSRDGTRILIASMFGTASLKSVDTGATLAELAGSAMPIHSAVFSQDGERVATANIDRTVQVWNARTGKLVATLEGTTRTVFSGWFSRDGARIITTSEDNTAKLWDATTGKLVASYDGHQDGITDALFSPDEGRVLTISADRIAKLWDARTGKLLASLDGPTDDLLDGKFSPDGTHVTTASRDGTISIWDVHLEQREPAEIRRIVAARNPWTLSNGVLVPDRLKGNR
jgi:eukaryotic-like serine/threonine-protein kinase